MTSDRGKEPEVLEDGAPRFVRKRAPYLDLPLVRRLVEADRRRMAELVDPAGAERAARRAARMREQAD